MRTRIHLAALYLIMLLLTLLSASCSAPAVGPRAEFIWTHETTFDVLFEATASDGGDSVLIAWEWTFGDGESASGEVVSHTFAAPGDYTVKLTVIDERGFKAIKRHTVHAMRELLVPEDYWTIQEAIDDAGPGDIVIVSPGRYWESFTFRGKAICVRSIAPNDPKIVARTIIEPGMLAGGLRTGPMITFDSGEGPDSVLEGLTIQGLKQAGAMYGNGAFVSSSSPTIRGNIFVNHLAGSSGAALYLFDSAAFVVDNRFENNSCDPLKVGEPETKGYDSKGGAILVLCTSKAPTIANNGFYNNTAIAGGAVYVASGSIWSGNTVARAEIQGNTFISNRATGKYAPANQTTDVGGAIQAEYEALIDLGPHDTNLYHNNLPKDIYYEYASASSR